jgi:hypothetical protein
MSCLDLEDGANALYSKLIGKMGVPKLRVALHATLLSRFNRLVRGINKAE